MIRMSIQFYKNDKIIFEVKKMKLKRLRELREDKDLTQKDIAKLLETTPQYYYRYETGKIDIPVKHIIKLCKYYNVTSDYILELSDEYKELKKKD